MFLPIRYTIQPDLVSVEITGPLLAMDILAFYRELAADARFRPGTPFLVDARGVTEAPPSAPLEATAIASHRAAIFAVPTKSASVVSTAWMFGVVRQWAAMSAGGKLVVRPFYDEAEARRWLTDPGGFDEGV